MACVLRLLPFHQLCFFVDRTNFFTSPFSKAHIIFHRTGGGGRETNGLKCCRNLALLGRLSNFFGNKYLNYCVLCPREEDAECFWLLLETLTQRETCAQRWGGWAQDMKTQEKGIFKMDIMNQFLWASPKSVLRGTDSMSALHSVMTYYLLCGKSLAKCHELSWGNAIRSFWPQTAPHLVS